MQWYRFYNFYKKNKPNHFWSQETSGKAFFNDLGIDDKYSVQHLSQQIKKINNKKFFGVIQLNSTHYPYNVPKEYQKWNKSFSDAYDNSVLYQDAVLAELWETLKTENKLDNTIVFFVSDHGESLKDHSNIGHVDSYYAETISIPLMVYLPKKIAKDFDMKQFLQNKSKNVANTDIAPTIVDLLKINSKLKIKSISPNFAGHSLFSKIPKNREIITMNNNDVAKFKIGVSLIKGDLHYLWRINMVPNREELYNLRFDPLEKDNLIKKYSKSRLDFLLKGLRKHRICRKFLRKYELF
jgi:arylsulfatase A-like enzyme